MKSVRTFVDRLLSLFRHRRLETDLDDEVRAHLDMLAADYEHRGLSPTDARFAARRTFGGVEQMKEAYRDRRGLPFVETLAQDARYALRALGRHRVFTAVAIVSLALGIGATTAVFSVVNAAMLRPLAAKDVGDLVVLEPQRNNRRFLIFNPEFEELRGRQRTLTGMFATSEQPYLRVEFPPDPPIYVTTSLVSGSYFEVLGIAPEVGRLLVSEDDDLSAANRPCAAVIGDALWSRRFDRRRDAIGGVIRVRDRECAIVGVAPAGFSGHQAGSVTDLWLPLRRLSDRRLLESQTMAFFSGVMGRLRAGVTRAQAEAELTTLFQHIQALEPPVPAQSGGPQPSELRMRIVDGSTGLSGLRRGYGRALALMLGAVALVLLVAAANVASLLLSRGVSRLPELATRAALGASRWRITRQLATEGGALAACGGLLGVGLAVFITPLLASAIPSQAPLDVSPDRRVLLAALASTMLVALVIGVIPALRLSGSLSQGHLAPGERVTEAAGSQRTLRALLVVQFALSLTLVTVAGLLLRTFIGLSAIDPGFDPGNVVMLEVADETPGAGFNAPDAPEAKASRAARYRRIEERLNALPAVHAASLSWLGLFSANNLWLGLIDPRQPDDRRQARVDYVSPRYFDVVGLRLVRGRTLTGADTAGAPRVAVINEALAHERFVDRDPLGSQFALDYDGERDRPFTIVGVVRDSRYNSLRETQAASMMWMSLEQAPFRVTSVSLRVTHGYEAEVSRATAALLRTNDPYLMVRKSTTLADQVKSSIARERLLLNLSSALGLSTLVLAAVGLYGTFAYKVARRWREFGVRIALGSPRSSVVGLIFTEALLLAGGAAIVGIPLALIAGYLLRTFLFGVAPQDPATVAAACAVLGLTVVLAVWAPAIRASLVDPASVLRSE